MRLLIRPRWPVVVLLLIAPGIPELLTGSTPITPLFFDPPAFLLSFAFLIALYGTGALLIREFVVVFRKGWASVLLLGAAYGIAEEGFAAHTFFRTVGPPVDALATYGHAFGVNWLWALGLTVFHATYSIALPILLVNLAFPPVRSVRWLDGGGVAVVAVVYGLTVLTFDLTIPFAPSLPLFLLFFAIAGGLVILAYRAPGPLLHPRPGPSRIGRTSLVLAGTLGFDAWLVVLLLAGSASVPAAGAAAIFVGVDLAAFGIVLRRVGTATLERSEFYFATGMLGVLFVWDAVFVEWVVPGVLVVTAVAAYLLYRLGQAVRVQAEPPSPPSRA